MANEKRIKGTRAVLFAGSIVFGLSALWLLVAPGFFNELLGLETTPALEWSMRMIAITLVALAGNMFSVSLKGTVEAVKFSGLVMLFCAFGLGLLTLLIPAPLTWFAISYAAVGFGFSLAYLVAILRK